MIRTLDEALRLAKLGYAMLPIAPKGKKPMIERGFLGASEDPKKIREWWRKWPKANLGLATSGLVVVDVDPVDGGPNPWAEDSRAGKVLQEAGAIARTGREHGRHFYFAGKTRNRQGVFPGVDVKSTRGLVVAPPSVHANGCAYRWECELAVPPDELPQIPPALVDSLRGQLSRSRASESARSGVDSVICKSESSVICTSVRLQEIEANNPGAIEAAIRETLPERIHTRVKCIWQLVGRLKRLDLRGPPFEFRPVIDRWYELALPNIDTKDREETRVDFADAWVSYDPEREFGAWIEAAKARPVPLGLESAPEPMQAIAKLCVELASRNQGGVFYLSCRKAGEAVGLRHTAANKVLGLLEKMGYLGVVTPGVPGKNGKATRWRWLGGKR